MSDKTTAADIAADPRELWMNSPVGYAFAERVEKSNVGGLKSFLINVFAPGDDAAGEAIRAATQEELIQTLLNSGFTFDPEWYGIREIPKGPSGQPLSRLDDPVYRRSIGLGS